MARKRGAKKRETTLLQRELRQTNRQLQSERARGLSDLSVNKQNEAEFGKVGKVDKGKYKAGKDTDVTKARKMLKQFAKQTKKKKKIDKQAETLAKTAKTSKANALKMIDIFATDSYHKLVELGYLESKQVKNYARKYNEKDLERAMSDVLKQKGTNRTNVDKRISDVMKLISNTALVGTQFELDDLKELRDKYGDVKTNKILNVAKKEPPHIFELMTVDDLADIGEELFESKGGRGK